MTTQRSNKISFDLSTVPDANKRKAWKDKLNEFYEYDFKLPDDFSNFSVKGCRIGGMTCASVRSDAMSLYRTPSHVACNPRDFYVLILPREDKILLSQRKSEALVGNGQFSLVNTDEPCGHAQNSHALFNSLILPGNIIRQLSPKVLNRVAVPSRNDAATKLFTDFANNFCENICTFGEQSQICLSNTLISLLELASEDVDYCSNQKSVKVAHRQRILQLVDQEFRDPSFGVQRISEALRISVRYIHHIFRDQDESVSSIIRKRRIDEACRLLSTYGPARLSISTLTYRVGFTNLSHFSRVFKDETGCSPSEYSGKAQ